MLNNVIKNLSILKKFLFINFLFFLVIGILTALYLKNVQPNLIKKKSANLVTFSMANESQSYPEKKVILLPLFLVTKFLI